MAPPMLDLGEPKGLWLPQYYWKTKHIFKHIVKKESNDAPKFLKVPKLMIKSPRSSVIRDIFQFLYLKQNHPHLSIHCRCYWFLSVLDHIQARLKKLITSHMIFALEWMNIWPIKFPCWSPWSSSCETLNKVCRSKLHDCAVFFLSWTVILSFFDFFLFFIRIDFDDFTLIRHPLPFPLDFQALADKELERSPVQR